MRFWVVCLVVGAILSSAVVPAAAHHVITAKFDPAKPVTLNGTVVTIDWSNPHVHLFVNVNGAGTITNWAIELESPIDLQKGGWNRDTLKVGDAVTVQGITARDGSKQAWANSVVLAAGNKKIFTVAAPSSRRNT